MASHRRAGGLLAVVVQGIYSRDGWGQLVRLAGVIEGVWARGAVKTSTSVQEGKTIIHNQDPIGCLKIVSSSRELLKQLDYYGSLETFFII